MVQNVLLAQIYIFKERGWIFLCQQTFVYSSWVFGALHYKHIVFQYILQLFHNFFCMYIAISLKFLRSVPFSHHMHTQPCTCWVSSSSAYPSACHSQCRMSSTKLVKFCPTLLALGAWVSFPHLTSTAEIHPDLTFLQFAVSRLGEAFLS